MTPRLARATGISPLVACSNRHDTRGYDTQPCVTRSRLLPAPACFSNLSLSVV
jgi:hypothetical protein